MVRWGGSHGPRAGCGAAIVQDGRILLVKRLRDPEAGCWGLPGGKIDWMETVERSVLREIREELSITLSDITLLNVVNQIDVERDEHWVAVVYLATSFTGAPALLERDKHDEIGWFELSHLPEPLTAATKDTLPILRRIANPVCGLPKEE
ncbi:ADP-ribose pyrophosphatase [Burkholderia sp. SRS-46]|nr:ADP-ribose pyrophosphatase [Burkholderia sp. SRS-46]